MRLIISAQFDKLTLLAEPAQPDTAAMNHSFQFGLNR